MNSSSSSRTAAPYNTISRGFKATTSKLIGVTTIRRQPGLHTSFGNERSPSVTERGDPGRFVEGVNFKGKLIGVLEVTEARGDRMCQEALAELKTAVRAAGEHKQRILISVAMDGIRLTDERTADCLYHHPVHKISFIAQDMTDTRAFGYIFGSPDAGHKFFGIKSEKAASQVVIAMRDLFQVVFERKKKEIEKARAQLEEGRDGSDFKDSGYGGYFGPNGESGIVSASLTSGARGAIADLLDLQSELTSLQRGLSEISKRTQAAQQKHSTQQPTKDEAFDPFGDSFQPGASGSSIGSEEPKPLGLQVKSSNVSGAPVPLAPPPVSGRSRHDSSNQKIPTSFSQTSDFAKFPVDFKNLNQPSPDRNTDRYAVFSDLHPPADVGQDSRFADEGSNTSRDPRHALREQQRYSEDRSPRYHDEASVRDHRYSEEGLHRKSISGSSSNTLDSARKEEFELQWDRSSGHGGSGYDIFTELDPLGTGKIKPFVDKKDFFNDVRRVTARRLLRELGDGEEAASGLPGSSSRVQPGKIPPEVSALVASTAMYSGNQSSSISSIKHPSTSTYTTPIHGGTTQPAFADSFNPPHSSSSRQRHDSSLDQMDNSSSFADFNQFQDSPKSQRSDFSSGNLDEAPTSLSVGSLTVALPPESFRDSPPPFSPPPPPRLRSTSGASSPIQQQYSPVFRNKLIKQPNLIAAASPVSPKTLPRSHKFSKQNSYDIDLRSDYLESPRTGSISSTGESNLSPRVANQGGISPRPRPRSSLSKQLSSSSATLPMRSSFSRSLHRKQKVPEESSFRPFPIDTSGSSQSNYGEPPEPPPRPNPRNTEGEVAPPLPPKRLPSHITLKPPPRPPVTAESHYNYTNEFDSSPDDLNLSKSPPIPIPARKVRNQSGSSRKQSFGEPFQFPKASHSPSSKESPSTLPKSASRNSSKSSTPRSGIRGISAIENVELTNTSLQQLAIKLHIPINQLAKMTVVELAACLAQLQLKNETDADGYEFPYSESNPSRHSRRASEEWDQAKFEDDAMFARFDAQFPKSPEDTKSFHNNSEEKITYPQGAAPVSEDRYAVFRELAAPKKSVFDENFLTPQNSMEDEISEVSSGTFKANFHQDSVEQKSSFSDEIEALDEARKRWQSSETIDHECVTVFRSPDISEYENFEPNFECKFEDNFTASEKSFTPINSPVRIGSINNINFQRQASVPLPKKSPFVDDFSKVSDISLFAKIPTEEKFVANFNISTENGQGDYYSSLPTEETSRVSLSASEKSPFEDDFSDFDLKVKEEEPSVVDKYDNVFTNEIQKKKKRDPLKAHKKKDKNSLGDSSNNLSVEKSHSPFEDDFIQRTCKYEVLRDLDAERDSNSPFEDSWQGSTGQINLPSESRKSVSSNYNNDEFIKTNSSPFEGAFPTPDSRNNSIDQERLSRNGSDRIGKSPYSETMGELSDQEKKSRFSVGSEVSLEVDQAAFEDNFTPTIERKAQCSSIKSETNSNFADFENAFSEEGSMKNASGEDQNEFNGQETFNEDDPDFPDLEEDFKVSARFPKIEDEDFQRSPRFSEKEDDDPKNIFRRKSDPFSDDFFDGDPSPSGGVAIVHAPVNNTPPNSSKDAFWDDSFNSFKFNEV